MRVLTADEMQAIDNLRVDRLTTRRDLIDAITKLLEHIKAQDALMGRQNQLLNALNDASPSMQGVISAAENVALAYKSLHTEAQEASVIALMQAVQTLDDYRASLKKGD